MCRKNSIGPSPLPALVRNSTPIPRSTATGLLSALTDRDGAAIPILPKVPYCSAAQRYDEASRINSW